MSSEMGEDSIATTTVIASLLGIALSGIFDNHFWRLLLCFIVYHASMMQSWTSVILLVTTLVMICNMPMYRNLISKLPRKGCIFITGCDSGMGQATVIALAKSNTTKTTSGCYSQIFAACLNAKQAKEEYAKLLTPDELKYVTLLDVNVSDPKSVDTAMASIQEYLKTNSQHLTGMIQFHGIAYNGPAQYMPMEMYQEQIDVNFMGTVRVVQKCLPLLRQSPSPARIVLTGTGGGSCSPCPPLLTAYMSSKFALEAYGHALRQELYMARTGIEVCIINPGFVKPTLLMAHGKKLTDKLWTMCPEIAKKEFGPMMDHFIHYSTLQPGTHVSQVCTAAEHALLAPVPRTSYKVGIDSKLAPIVGMMPTGMRETIARHGIYGILSPAGTVKDYQL